jgi:hypothetical protein
MVGREPVRTGRNSQNNDYTAYSGGAYQYTNRKPGIFYFFLVFGKYYSIPFID